MSSLTWGEILILSVWAVSGPALNHAVKKAHKGSWEAAAAVAEWKDVSVFSLCLKEDKEHIVKAAIWFISQTPAYSSIMDHIC